MGETTLRDGSTVADPRLDRLVQFDDRSRAFPLRELITPAQAKKPRSYTWAVWCRLDQGNEGACVGFAITHEAAARPHEVPFIDANVALSVYGRAQQIDEWPGEAYSGTSVLAGIKAGQERGWYGEYRWGFGLDDLMLAVGYKGPAVLGIPWYEGMFDTDADGFVRVNGNVAGGHAILCNGVDVKKKKFRLTNSWGPSWGWGGQAWISFDDLDRLLHEAGESCIPVVRAGA
jgi:hypothetical protein